MLLQYCFLLSFSSHHDHCFLLQYHDHNCDHCLPLTWTVVMVMIFFFYSPWSIWSCSENKLSFKWCSEHSGIWSLFAHRVAGNHHHIWCSSSSLFYTQVVKPKTENKPKSDKKPMSFSEMAKKPGQPQPVRWIYQFFFIREATKNMIWEKVWNVGGS